MSPLEQLSGTDAALLALESAETPMQVLGVLLLDPTGEDARYSYERLRSVLAERVHLMPPFTRQLMQVPLHLDRPYWEPVTDVDVDAHMSRIHAAAPGDWHVLCDIVGDIASRTLPRDRPLWDVVVIDGLNDGRVAVVARIHHATLYGATGVEFIAQLLDFDAAGRTLEPGAMEGTNTVTDAVTDTESISSVEIMARAVLHQAGTPIRAGRLVAGTARGVLSGLLDRARGKATGSMRPSFAPSTPLNGRLTEHRSTAFVRVPLDDLKAVKDAHGGTVNDVVLAATAYGLRRYLLAHDADITTRPVANCPTSQGGAEVAGTDRIGWLSVTLPVDVEDPVEQLHEVSLATKDAKAFTDAIGGGFVADMADVVPAMLLASGGRMYSTLGLSRVHPPLCSLVVSNMIGPPIPLYLAGARIEAIFPLGPLLPGVGVNVTVLSDMGQLDVGVLACPDLVSDPWQIAEGFVEGVARLRESVA